MAWFDDWLLAEQSVCFGGVFLHSLKTGEREKREKRESEREREKERGPREEKDWEKEVGSWNISLEENEEKGRESFRGLLQ